jgi:hypothetical protein
MLRRRTTSPKFNDCTNVADRPLRELALLGISCGQGRFWPISEVATPLTQVSLVGRDPERTFGRHLSSSGTVLWFLVEWNIASRLEIRERTPLPSFKQT